MSVYDEQGALNGLRKLDPQSIGAIYDQYFPEVHRFVRYRINDNAVAEDIASDVFVRLLEASQKRQGPDDQSQRLADRDCVKCSERSFAPPISQTHRSPF